MKKYQAIEKEPNKWGKKRVYSGETIISVIFFSVLIGWFFIRILIQGEKSVNPNWLYMSFCKFL